MSARKRPGPVPKDPAERRTVAVMARISPAEHERLINALAAENRRIATAGETPYTAVSDVVREALREWCAKVEASTQRETAARRRAPVLPRSRATKPDLKRLETAQLEQAARPW